MPDMSPLVPPAEEQLFAQSTLRGLEALVHQVRQLEQLRRQYVELAREHASLLDANTTLRAALHLIGQTYVSARTAEQRLDLIVEVVHEALGNLNAFKTPEETPPAPEGYYGISQAEAEIEERLTQQELTQEAERANHDLEDPNG